LRFYAANSATSGWAPSSATFSTTALKPSDFGSRLKISVNGYNRGETLANFPLLVNLSTNMPGFSYRQFASPSGGDLRFADAGGLTPLAHEVDEWNTNGISSIWVRVPVITSSNDFIWAYWGNPLDANAPASTTNGAVWSAEHHLVWHLKEAGFPYGDSAAHHPALSGIAPSSTSGKIGRGVAFIGTSQFLNAGAVDLGNAFTLSAWVKIDATATDIQPVWANKSGGWNANGFALFVNSYQTVDQMLRLETGDGVDGRAAVSAVGAVSFGQWHLLAASVDRAAGSARLFVDGTDVTQNSAAMTDFANSGEVDLAQITNGGFNFKGVLDEARVENVVRSSNWVWAAWLNAASNSTFVVSAPVIRQLPALSLAGNSSNGLALSWPASGVGFAVSTTTNLKPPIIWTPVTNQPVLANAQWQIMISRDVASRFYRLQSP
jgi:hypothetical protein